MITKLQDYQFKICYIKGKDNVMADFASRPPNDGLSTFDELRKELDENAQTNDVNAVMRVDLREIV